MSPKVGQWQEFLIILATSSNYSLILSWPLGVTWHGTWLCSSCHEGMACISIFHVSCLHLLLVVWECLMYCRELRQKGRTQLSVAKCVGNWNSSDFNSLQKLCWEYVVAQGPVPFCNNLPLMIAQWKLKTTCPNSGWEIALGPDRSLFCISGHLGLMLEDVPLYNPSPFPQALMVRTYSINFLHTNLHFRVYFLEKLNFYQDPVARERQSKDSWAGYPHLAARVQPGEFLR